MSIDTAIQSGLGHSVPPPRPSKPQRSPAVEFVRRLLGPLASLRLTVVLFAFAILLVFFGTLAQVDLGIFTIVGKYFRSLYVWVPFKIFLPRTWVVSGGFPFPGGWLIGGLLLGNLLAAHLVRFKLSWKRSGVLILHAGLIIMMVSELIVGLYGVEGNMTIEEGKASNYIEHRDRAELVVIERTDPKFDDVVAIPAALLRKGGAIAHDALPFDVTVERFMANSSEPKAADPDKKDNPATAGDGLQWLAVEQPEVSEADPNQNVDLPSAYVTFKKKGSDEVLGTYLVSLWLSAIEDKPQRVTVDGKTYDVYLRFPRTYKPYTVHLIDFRHEVYLGTETPKDFSSHVQLIDSSRGVDKDVVISMNDPLRHAGETFYQSSFLPGDKGTVLQVVRNPGWLMPYISCVVVGLGMLIHFGMNLYSFLRRRVA